MEEQLRELPSQLKNKINACLKHAEDLLSSSKIILQEKQLPNIAYHLAVLSLEEVGKLHFLIMSHGVQLRNNESTDSWLKNRIEDHTKKIFIALFAPSFNTGRINKAQISFIRELSKNIHEKRLKGLYVEVFSDTALKPKESITENEAKNIIELAENLVELEKSTKYKPLNNSQIENLSWFLSITEDVEKRKLIFGKKSLEKLSELNDARKWVNWVKKQFDKADEEGRQLAEKEIRRKRSYGKADTDQKWKIRICFISDSHSIRPKQLNWWNNVYDWIELIPTHNKKNELLVEFTLPKSILINQLWGIGWGISRQFAIALNIGSLGFFWWYIPDQISRFYTKLYDLEENSEVVFERSPILKIEWGKHYLSENDLSNISLCLSKMPPFHDTKKTEPFDHYLGGLIYLSKNDIHLQFESQAYLNFYNSLKTGMRNYGDWKKTTFDKAFKAYFSDIIPEQNEIEELVSLGKNLEKKFQIITEIDLEKVGKMKTMCDYYFITTFKKLAAI